MRELRVVAAPGTPRPPIDVLEAVVRDLKVMLDEVSEAVTGERLSFGLSRLALSSVDLAIEADTEQSYQSLEAIVDGLAWLESGAVRPPHFSTRSLRSAQRLGALGKRHGLSIWTHDNRRVSVGKATEDHARDLLKPRRHYLGSLLGRLEAVSVHGGHHFSLFPRRGNAIECTIDAQMFKIAVDLLGSRVLVEGTVHENASGDVIRIDAKDVYSMRDSAELPKVRDILGAYRPFIEGRSTSDYLAESWEMTYGG